MYAIEHKSTARPDPRKRNMRQLPKPFMFAVVVGLLLLLTATSLAPVMVR